MKLRVLFSIHLFPPEHNCGAEYVVYNMAKELIKRGHEVRVFLHMTTKEKRPFYEWDGIPVWTASGSHQAMTELFNWCTTVVTHLDYAKWSIWKAKSLGKPCIFLGHNESDYYDDMINSSDNVFPIYNCHYAKSKLDYQRPSMVQEPPLNLNRCIAPDQGRKYITLINLCENKGVKQFYEVAKKMPGHHFLGIQGSYMEQEYSNLANVTIWPNQTDIRKVYEVARVLLVLSDYESWSMCASEALANGIPVICTTTPGLMENCGDAAQYVDRDATEKIISLLKQLDNGKHYAKWSEAGLKRTAERPNRYDELEQFLYKANEYRYEYNR